MFDGDDAEDRARLARLEVALDELPGVSWETADEATCNMLTVRISAPAEPRARERLLRLVIAAREETLRGWSR